MIIGHICIAYKQFSILPGLIHDAGLAPTVYQMLIPPHRRNQESRRKKIEFETFNKILSPLCVALLSGEHDIAEHFLQASYLTVSDLNLSNPGFMVLHLIRNQEMRRL